MSSVMGPVQNLSAPVKFAVDVSALGTLIATLLSYLPALASILTVVWLGLRIYESLQTIRLNSRKLSK